MAACEYVKGRLASNEEGNWFKQRAWHWCENKFIQLAVTKFRLEGG